MGKSSREIEIQGRSVAFISQKQQYQWRIDLPHFEATMLVFQEDFLNEFFSDAYFTYLLWYFYNAEYPAFLPLSEALFSELAAFPFSFSHQIWQWSQRLGSARRSV